MKGVVFNILNEMVEDKFGLNTWESVLERANPESEGIYSSGEIYPDEEIFQLVAALSEITQISATDLVREFGEYMFPSLAKAHPIFLKGHTNAKDFLKTVNDVIHVEVRKLDEDSSLPSIQFEDLEDSNILLMTYYSPRKLCHLSEGLINGAAKHFNTEVEIKHRQCMHDGNKECKIEIKFSGQ